MSTPVLNYTSKVAVTKTIGEVQELLAKHGATRVAINYDAGSAVGISFAITTVHGPRVFTLPVDVDQMFFLLAERRPSGGIAIKEFHSIEHAERVAWRVVKDWLAAQLTLVQSQMAAIDQVMLPYLHVDDTGRTLYAAYRDNEAVLALEGRR